MFCSHSGVFQTAAVMLTGFLSVARLNNPLRLYSIHSEICSFFV